MLHGLSYIYEVHVLASDCVNILQKIEIFQINDFLKNMIYQNNKSQGLSTVRNSNNNINDNNTVEEKNNENPEEQKKSSDYLKNSIEAYKNSLRNNPNDEDTRYNLSYALSKLKQQQQQENHLLNDYFVTYYEW